MKVLCFGSLNLDHIYHVRDFVRPGETRGALSVETRCGGKGFNQAAAAARAGLSVSMAGCIGPDGGIFLDKCREESIDTADLLSVDLPTGSTVIQVNGAGENCILLYGGANRAVSPAQIDAALASMGEGDVLMLQNEINGLEYLTQRAFQRGIRIALNPSPMDEQITASMLKRVSWLFVNEVEAAQLCGCDDVQECLERLGRYCPGGSVILTLGSKGSYCREANEEIWYQPAFSVRAVDTTAAGDTFTGYFLAGVLSGGCPGAALRLGSRAAALAVTRQGAFDSIPRRAELESV